MRVLFLTIPSSGEANVQLATAQALVSEGHEVVFMSGNSFAKTIARFKQQQTSEKRQFLIDFIPLGSARSVEDFTPVVQDRIQHMRKEPGDFSSISTCMEIALVSAEEHIATALKVRNHIMQLDPDMIVVDCLSPAMVNGVRMTKRKWLMSIPCSPGLTALPSLFAPHPMAADRTGSWKTGFENLWLRLSQYRFCCRQPEMLNRRTILQTNFRLKSFGFSSDMTLLPPYWEDPHCVGGIHFNVAGLTDAPSQPASMVFVGAGIIEEKLPAVQCAVLDFMNTARALGQDVVYINMGSMFIWSEVEFNNCIQALDMVYERMQGRVRFILKTNKPMDDSRAFIQRKLPDHILHTHWIESQQAVLQHPALKVIVHHGGGNLFNEAVYFGVPQLILSQWLDTHELGQLATTFGFGLRSARPPYIEAEDICEKLLCILGPEWDSFKASADSWALRSKLGGGAAAAAKIILSHAQSSCATRKMDSDKLISI